MHIMERIAAGLTCRVCREGRLVDPCPITILEKLAYEGWCDACGGYHLVFANKLGQVQIQGTAAENWENLRKGVDKLALDATVRETSKTQSTTQATHSRNHQTPTRGDKDTEMPKIVEDFDPTIRRTGSGSGRPQIFHIDLKPLDQVAGKTNQKGDPVFVQYTRNDLDGAADATFQQQVRAYAENMDKGKTKHGYRAVVRTDPLMETDKDGNASPVTDDEGKQVVDFYVAVVPVTDRDIARRKSYAQARANGKEGEDGNETGNAGDESANAASKGKETAKA